MKLSVVIPVYNGSKSIERLVKDLFQQLADQVNLEIVLVNDCSPDDSWKKITTIYEEYHDSVIAINLAKNFGEHNAVMVGYRFCQGDYIVNIDDDFQNPPSEILKLLDKIQKGYDVVYSYYANKEHSSFRNLGSQINDKVANIILNKSSDLYLSSFRIISAKLREEIIQYNGPYPYIDGLILRATSNISQVEVKHQSRAEGQSNYTLWKLIRLWSHMFFNFSLIPLRFATGLGLLFSFIGLIGTISVIFEKLFYPDLPIGWASLIVSFYILGGVQLFTIGIVGEYVGRIFLSQNKTPQYVIRQILKE